MSLGDLANVCQGQLIGQANTTIKGVCSIETPVSGCLTYLSSPRFFSKIDPELGCAYIVTPANKGAIALGIIHDNPTQAFRLILDALYPPSYSGQIATTAVISDSACLGKNVTVGDYAVIGDHTVIKSGSVIGANTVIHSDVFIDENSRLGSHVTIHNRCTVGAKCVIADGAVIGSQGFGFSFEGGRWEPIQQVGSVIIGDGVHIGANSCIDRGAINDTVIGNNVIIDNLVHIAHNVEIGERTAMAAGVGIAGSTKIGKNCLLAGQVGVVGHIEIADGVQVNGGARILQSIKEPGGYAGSFHVMPAMKWNRIAAYLKKLEILFTKEKQQ